MKIDKAVGTSGLAVLECSHLVKSFGSRKAVNDISFQIDPGECYGMLGPNGAGKTTTISIACGLLQKDSGLVKVNGKELNHKSILPKRDIGYVPQDLALYPELSASDNLRFFGRLYGLSGRELEGRINETLETVGLIDRRDDRIESFSGGMKRRANIAAGLLHKPSLLVLDEPTVGVDPQSRNAILEAVQLLSNEGMAVLYTTHYMEEAERLCDRVGIIDKGQIVAEGTRRELVEQLGSLDRIRISVSGMHREGAEVLRKLDGVQEVIEIGDEIEVLIPQARLKLPSVIEALVENHLPLTSLEVVEPNLEAVFLALTGRELRD
ncbi:MAG: ABC transporter ATP-binding protein [Acidimicrobiales bacterium]|nr:ABC transporter ATP-binding protein [Acidimicrobiales bacterium]